MAWWPTNAHNRGRPIWAPPIGRQTTGRRAVWAPDIWAPFWVTMKQAIPWMPLSANLFRLEFSIQKHGGFKGAAPGGCGGVKPSARKKKLNFFLVQHFSKFQFFFNFSNLHERSRIGWIERKTKFPIFIFRVMVIFVLKITQIFTHSSKNKNWRIFS